jgi:hypothetical protein
MSTVADSPTVPAEVPDPGARPRWENARRTATATLVRARGALPVLGEAAVGLGAAALSVQLAMTIRVDPLDRIGQVSGLAGLGLHFSVLGLTVLALVVALTRWTPPPVAAVARAWGAAAVAGLVTGFVAGGLVVALSGTSWPLFANSGDAGQISVWVADLMRGVDSPADYPPLALQGMAWWSEATGAPPTGALRAFEIGGAAVFGPIAYLGWRCLLRPGWALAMTLAAAVPLMDLYKPYANLVLVVLLPVLIRLLQELRRSVERSWLHVGLAGLAFGVVLGVLFLCYSGWFVWTAPGAVVAAALAMPWRRPARAVFLAVTTIAAFVVVADRHLWGLIAGAGSVTDRYYYFDTFTEPAYIAMWRNDTAGDVGPWPPPGELGGMGVFSALLVVGLAVALWLGRGRRDVTTLAVVLAGAWVVRFWIASRMYATDSVQLYPRTTVEILYCLLALTVLAVMLGFARLPRPGILQGPAAGVAVLAPALLAGLFMASATADRYMPNTDGSAGYLAFVSHHVRQLDGRCSPSVRYDQCYDSAALVEALRTVPPRQRSEPTPAPPPGRSPEPPPPVVPDAGTN